MRRDEEFACRTCRVPLAVREPQRQVPAWSQSTSELGSTLIVSLRERERLMPRELIDTGTDKRYVRRDDKGQFKEGDDVGRSLAQDQKRDAAKKPKRGEGDKGDR